MTEFKNNIKLGFTLDSSKDVESKLKGIIEQLNKNKINLDINIKNSDVEKQLNNLIKLTENFKKNLGGNISLGDIDKTISKTTNAISKLNGEILKTSTSKQGDILSITKTIANGIGETTKQTEKYQQLNGSLIKMGETLTRTTVDSQKFNNSMKEIESSIKLLNNLKINGFVESGNIDKLKGELLTIYETSNKNGSIKFTDNELSPYINKVKELVSLESKIIDFSNKLTSLKSSMGGLTDDKYSSVLNKQGFETIVNDIDKAQKELKNFDGTNLNGLKQQFTELSNSVSKFSSETVNAEKNQRQSIQEIEKTADLLQKQEQAYQRLNTLKSNKIIDTSEINNLEKLSKSASSLKEINNILSSIGKTESRESSISTLSKQIDEAKNKLEKMKSVFGERLSNTFIESTERELNKLMSELKQVDGVNFNGIKNGLNSVKASMEQTNSQTKNLVNSLKETNSGGFFTGISNFLGKIGVFYGVQQVFQEISTQLRNASQYAIEMDARMTNMSMITGKSRESVSQMANEFKNLASQLHETNSNILAGGEELMRSGYDNQTTKKMLEASTIASKISGQTNEATTSQLIAIKNAFDMTGDEVGHVVDVISKLDNTSATSLDFDDLVA